MPVNWLRIPSHFKADGEHLPVITDHCAFFAQYKVAAGAGNWHDAYPSDSGANTPEEAPERGERVIRELALSAQRLAALRQADENLRLMKRRHR
jgi:hypothetical protein